MENENPLTLKTIAAVTAYFLVIFYFFGAVDTNYNLIYRSFPKIHEHYDEYMSVFNASTRILLTYSSFALIGTSVALLWFRPNSFPRTAIWISIILASTSAIATLFFIMPIHLSLWVSGYNEALFQKLMTITYYFQFIPSLAQILLGFWLLNRYLGHIKFIRRWVFILFITLTFLTTNYGNFTYLLYITVGSTDWAAFRTALYPDLFFIGLLMAFTPMFLTIPMFWLRPKSVPRYFVGIYGLTIFWIFFISAFYLASKVQGYLEHNYSRLRTEELINADFMYRILPGMILTFIAVYMFVKAGQEKMEKQNLN